MEFKNENKLRKLKWFMLWSKDFKKDCDYEWDHKSSYLAVGGIANLVLTWWGWGGPEQDT